MVSEAAMTIVINRAPVMTLWAAVVAERLGFARDEALTLGRAVAGLNAQSKGRALGLFAPASPTDVRRKRREHEMGKALHVELLHRAVPATRTHEGLRALDPDGTPADPAAVERYLNGKFGDHLAAARRAMETLAAAYSPATLAHAAYGLYEEFRPAIPRGQAGWGAKGVLDLTRIRALAKRAP
jgi:hypothetical protein